MTFLDDIGRINRGLEIAGERVTPHSHLELGINDYIASSEAVNRLSKDLDATARTIGVELRKPRRCGLTEATIWVRDNIPDAERMGDVYSAMANRQIAVDVVHDLAGNTSLQNPQFIQALQHGYPEFAEMAQSNWSGRGYKA